MKHFLFHLSVTVGLWSQSHGLGMGLKSIVMPAPVPLGMTSVSDSSNATSELKKEIPSEAPASPPPPPPEEAHREELEFALKIAATAFNVLLQLSPLRLIMEIRIHKSVSTISPFPLIALTACGYQWSFYGFFAYTETANVGFLMLIYANILGLVLGLYYMLSFHYYAESGDRSSIYFQSVGLISLFVCEYIYCYTAQAVNSSLYFAGLLSAAISILVSFSPMVSLPDALRKHSIASVPVDMCVASLVSSVLWLFCGMLLGDPWVLIPNFIGVVFGIVQMVAIAYLLLDVETIHSYSKKFWSQIHQVDV